ncbi:PAS domain S-box protein [Methylocystis parvus]|uniref:hybrid sensor histidine kinase/response regulator n=1 Tax=Methylocystis parvus TaxID=134 RepID=UPI003C77AA3A
MRDSSHFKMLADNSPLFIGMCDLDYNPFYVNHAGRELVGLDDLDFSQIPVAEYFFPEDQDFVLHEFFPRVMKEGRAQTEIRFRHFKTGAAIWMTYDVFFLSDESGKPTGLATVSRDITEVKLAETALRASERRFHAIFDHQFEYSALLSPDENIVEISDSVFRGTGIQPAEVIGKPFLDGAWWRDLPEMRAQWRRQFKEATGRSGPSRGETAYRTRDGELRHAINTVTAIRDEEGKLEHLLLGGMDITERKRAEEHLARDLDAMTRLQRLGTLSGQDGGLEPVLLEIVDAAIAIGGADFGNIQLLDPVTGDLRIVAHRGFPPWWIEYWDAVAKGKGACGTALERKERVIVEDVERDSIFVGAQALDIQRKAGVRSVQSTPLVSRSGKVVGIFSTHYRRPGHPDDHTLCLLDLLARQAADIIEHAQSDAALRESDRLKDEFIATLAHELRNPLTPIHNAAQILKKRNNSDERDAALLDMIQRQTAHLVRLVDDLLEISRIKEGKIDLRKTRVSLDAVLRDALETCKSQIDQKGHRVTMDNRSGSSLVFGDPVRLVQIAANLINNAVKYTPPGGMIAVETGADGNEAVLSVRDNGVGIAPAMLPHVFDIFAQAARPPGVAQDGLGIGLALVRKLVEIHGGRIEARSAGVGCGSEFLVWLPISKEAATASHESASGALPDSAGRNRDIRALVIDDDHDVGDSFGLLLKSMGAAFQVAYDGPSGIAAVEAFKPDLIFVDIGMPGMNGYEAASCIRESAHSHPFMLIALTGWGEPEDRRRTQEAGFDVHLVKPAPVEAIEELLGIVRRSLPVHTHL